jgi:hypothetical protein
MRLPPGSITYTKKPWATACLDGAASIVDVGVDEQVGGAQHSSRVSTQNARWCSRPCAACVLRVDQLVGGDRRAHPGAGLAAVVELDPLVEPVAERLLGEDAVGADVGGEHVEVVEALDRAAATGVALRTGS